MLNYQTALYVYNITKRLPSSLANTRSALRLSLNKTVSLVSPRATQLARASSPHPGQSTLGLRHLIQLFPTDYLKLFER